MKRVILLAILLILIACAGEAPKAKPGSIAEIEIKKPQALPQLPEYEPPPTYPYETGKVVEIAMLANDFKFTPNTINATMGDKVRITITAIDADHTFSLPVFGIEKSIPKGQSSTIEFLADKQGQFTYYCSVPGHAAQGMSGRIKIT